MELSEAWDFFSSPHNLKKITPKQMGFDIISDMGEEKMFPGMIVTYVVRPLLNAPMVWTTEITHVKDNEYFIDEQRFGPYAFWHHRHSFKEMGDKTLMADDLHYGLPLGIIGTMVNSLMVHSRINEIFDYRRDALEKMFNQKTSVLAL